MIAQLISFFLPKNSQESTTLGSCCHKCDSIEETEHLELTRTQNLPLKQRINPARVHNIALPLIREQKLHSLGDFSDSAQTGKKDVIEDFPLGRFMRFLKHIKLRNMLKQITDPRDPKKAEHKIHIILQWVLTVYFFRCESTNALQTAFEKLPRHRKDVLWNYFGLEQENRTLPHRTVVTDSLSDIDPEEINDLLEKLFKWALKSKIFYNHMETLLPDFHYHLACDGVWVHKYTRPHAKDEDGDNTCPYCLPRVHNKEKENEYTDWLHAFVNLAFIFPGGVQLPIYVYPLKAEQLREYETASDDQHKQESELQAVRVILPIIKQKFPKLPIKFLADSLYANEPLIKLCEELHWEYLIVRQVGSLKYV